MKLNPLVLGLATLSLFGCVDEKLGTTQGETFEEYLAQVQREPGTGRYVLDWDIVVTTEAQVYDVWKQSQAGQALSIYSVGGQDIKWPAAMQKALTYCVSNNFGARKAQVVAAFAAATTQGWELYGDVKFIYDATQDANCNANNNAVVFDVSPITGAQYLARAFFPDSPRLERNVMIDSSAFDPAQTGPITLTNIMIHELGHALGFRHEHIARPNQQTPGCVEDNSYRTLEGYDALSTMHYPQCGSPNNTLALSPKDQTGIALIYGAARVAVAPVASVTSPADGATVPLSFDVVANIVDDDITTVELYIDDVLDQTLTTGPYTFQVDLLSEGLHNLEVVATDSGGLTGSQPFSVNAREGNGNGNGDGDGDGDGDGTGNGDGTGGESADITGGCSTSSGGGAGLGMLLLGFVSLVTRRRRS